MSFGLLVCLLRFSLCGKEAGVGEANQNGDSVTVNCEYTRPKCHVSMRIFTERLLTFINIEHTMVEGVCVYALYSSANIWYNMRHAPMSSIILFVYRRLWTCANVPLLNLNDAKSVHINYAVHYTIQYNTILLI